MAKLSGYTGSVDLISGVRQKNGGTFPLMEAYSILVGANDERLDARLEGINSTLVPAVATGSTGAKNGLMTADDKKKLNGIDTNANKYTHPNTLSAAVDSGLYKITVNKNGHITAVAAVSTEDITTLGIPAQDTTYSAVLPTGSINGLMTPADKAKLNGIATGANKYTHPSYTSRTSKLYKVTVDSTGHVSGAEEVLKSDITTLGIPAQDTTYSAVLPTGSINGLMTPADKAKLNGIANNATHVIVDNALSTTSENAIMNKAVKNSIDSLTNLFNSHTHSGIIDRLDELEEILEDHLFVPIEFQSLTSNITVAEKGSTVSKVNLTMTYNKKPISYKIGNSELWNTIPNSMNPNLNYNISYTFELTLNATANTTIQITILGERSIEITRSVTVNFYNRIYYGVASIPSAYNSAFILGLSDSVISNNKARTINLNAGAAKYVYYCLPSGLGPANFSIGGFIGGFQLVATISHTNASGYTENYSIYRSDNPNLGQTSVTIS